MAGPVALAPGSLTAAPSFLEVNKALDSGTSGVWRPGTQVGAAGGLIPTESLGPCAQPSRLKASPALSP